MADGRILFAAHDGYFMFANSPFQPVDSLQKARRFGQPRVQHVPFVVIEFFFIGPPAKFLAQVKVLDVCLSQCGRQVFSVKMRHMSGIGGRTRVNQDLDPVFSKEFKKILQR